MKLAVSLLFPVKFVQSEIEIDDVKAQLLDDLVRAKIPHGSNGRSNVGAASWRSRLDLMKSGRSDTKSSALATILDRVRAFTRAAVEAIYDGYQPVFRECWLNVLGPGSYNAPHDHAPHALSGILWIDAESESDGIGGNVEFWAPFVGQHYATDSSLMIKPIDGVAIMFPSTVKHMVHPVPAHRRSRIALAWNVDVEKKT